MLFYSFITALYGTMVFMCTVEPAQIPNKTAAATAEAAAGRTMFDPVAISAKTMVFPPADSSLEGFYATTRSTAATTVPSTFVPGTRKMIRRVHEEPDGTVGVDEKPEDREGRRYRRSEWCPGSERLCQVLAAQTTAPATSEPWTRQMVTRVLTGPDGRAEFDETPEDNPSTRGETTEKVYVPEV